MAFEIREEILRKTIKCEKDFSCLSGETGTLCKIELHISDNTHVVKCLFDGYCSYQMFLETSCICTCPTRIEIYHHYKI